MLGLYIHVPFCAQKCNYCDFNSYKIEEKDQKKNYLISIKKEMELYKYEFKDKEFTSIFLGGGTPSILTSEELSNLMKNIYSNFNIKKDAEITMECNPGTLDKEKLSNIKSLGINRLSMGLQVTQDYHLKYIGRIHTYEQFEKNYKDAIEVGIDNINVDLMLAIPTQTKEELLNTLNKRQEHSYNVSISAFECSLPFYFYSIHHIWMINFYSLNSFSIPLRNFAPSLRLRSPYFTNACI